MPVYEFKTVDVFTEQRFGGNPLAVFPDARGMTDSQMQAIAREFNLSETSFVLPPQNPQHHAQVRIFTPRTELPFAGHPNVGTGYVLGRLAPSPPEHFVFEEIAGLVRVHLQHDAAKQISGARVSAPRSLSITIALPESTIADCVGLSDEDILTTVHTPLVASVGIPFVIAEVTSIEALSRASPDLSAFRVAAERFPEAAEHLAIHLYARRQGDATRLRTRMFSPLGGIIEDPATGSANAALAALLTSLAPGENAELSYEIEQGLEMGRPSRIFATARKTAEGPVTASISGNCISVMQGTLEV
jgi:trans-2,3-dihydro-3-hydroxyanthranilate isomerase